MEGQPVSGDNINADLNIDPEIHSAEDMRAKNQIRVHHNYLALVDTIVLKITEFAAAGKTSLLFNLSTDGRKLFEQHADWVFD